MNPREKKKSPCRPPPFVRRIRMEHLNKDTRSGTPYGADHHWRNSNRLEIGIGPREGERKAIELQPNLFQPRLRHAADA